MSNRSKNKFSSVKQLLDSSTPFKFLPCKVKQSREIIDLTAISESDDEVEKVIKRKPKRTRPRRNIPQNTDVCVIIDDETIKVDKQKRNRVSPKKKISRNVYKPLKRSKAKSSRPKKRLKQLIALDNDCCIVDITPSPPPISSEGESTKDKDTDIDNASQKGTLRRSTRVKRRPFNYSNLIYNIGNSSEYSDENEGVPLFSKSNNDSIELDDGVNIGNEVISVQVEWQSVDIFKFDIRKLQNIKQIYEFFSKKCNVGQDNLLFMYESKILQPEDTPDSIGYREAKVIDGGIVYKNKINPEIFREDSEKVESGIEIKFQYQNSKHPFISYVQNDETLLLAMTKCSEKLEIPLNKLKFEFDGDVISGKQTPNTLGLEGGECIDVKVIK